MTTPFRAGQHRAVALIDHGLRGRAGAHVVGPVPVPDAYWADPMILAGPLPTAADRDGLRVQLRGMLDAGVRTIVDLRTAAEPPGVRELFEKLARDDQPVAWTGFPVLNGAAPSEPLLQLILDTMDASLARSRGVYVHCAGGRGRTGTVIACWWIRHGIFEPEQALAELALRREGLPNGHMPSPETPAQWRLVRGWEKGR